MHSGPFLDPILGYHFTNDVTGECYNLQGIMDSVVISVFQIGEYYFTIIPYNCVGDGGAATSNVIYVEITQADPILSSSVGLSNYPNPFNPSTTISFSLTTESTENTEINIYNLKGQKIKTLECIACVDAVSSQRLHSIVWDGRDDNNKLVRSGIFLYQLKVDGKTVAKNKMLLLK